MTPMPFPPGKLGEARLAETEASVPYNRPTQIAKGDCFCLAARRSGDTASSSESGAERDRARMARSALQTDRR